MTTAQAVAHVMYVWIKLTDPSVAAQFPLPGEGYSSCSGLPPAEVVCTQNKGRPPPAIVAASGYELGFRRCRDDLTGALRLQAICQPSDAPHDIVQGGQAPFTGGQAGEWVTALPLGGQDGAHAWIESAEGLAWRADARTFNLLAIVDVNAQIQAASQSRAVSQPPSASAWKTYGHWDPVLKEKAEKARQVITNPQKERLMKAAQDSDPEVACQHVRRAMKRGADEHTRIRAEALTLDAMQAVLLDVANEWGVAGEVLPRTQALIQRLQQAVEEPLLHMKLAVNRARPQEQCHVQPVIPTHDRLHPFHASYPSGHATMAAATAHVFARILFPGDAKRAEQLLKAAKSVARRRVIAGLHFEDDSIAGLSLAEMLVGGDKWFEPSQEEAQRIRDEWGMH